MDGKFDAMRSPAAQWVGEIADADDIDPRTIRSAGLVQSMHQAVQDGWGNPTLQVPVPWVPIPAAGLGPGGVLVVGSYTAYIGLRSGRRRVTLLSVGNRVCPRVVPASPLYDLLAFPVAISNRELFDPAH